MATQYPNQIDTNLTLRKVLDLTSPILARDTNQLQEAIIAIENELGIVPSGTFVTVKDRLDAIVNQISSLEASDIIVEDFSNQYTDVDGYVTVESALQELGPVLNAASEWTSGIYLNTKTQNVLLQKNFLNSGVSQLSPVINVNGTPVEAHDLFIGNDADVTGDGYWPNRGANAGTFLEYDIPARTKMSLFRTPWGDGYLAPGHLDRGINSLTNWLANDTSVADIPDGYDMILEMVFKIGYGANYGVFDKRGTNPVTLDTKGLRINHQNDLGGLRFSFIDGVDSQAPLAGDRDYWVHFMMFFDFGEADPNSSKIYSNEYELARDNSGVTNTSTDTVMRLGGSSTNAQGIFAYFGFWTKENMFPGGAQNIQIWDEIYRQRRALLGGFKADSSEGESVAVINNSLSEKTTQVYNEDGYLQLYYISSNMLRYAEYKDNAENIQGGALVEAEVENRVPRSEEFTNTAIWTNTNIGTTDGYSDPARYPNACLAVPTGGSGVHELIDVFVVSNDLETRTHSVFIKSAGARYVQLCSINETGGNSTFVTFDIVDGTVFSESVGSNYLYSGIEEWLDGWYRVSITSISDLIQNLRIRAADATGNTSFTPNGLDEAFYIYGAQAEIGPKPTSYIRTFGSTEIRLADNISFAGDGGNVNSRNDFGKIESEVFIPNLKYDPTSSKSYGILSLSDGLVPEDSIVLGTSSDGYYFGQVNSDESGNGNQLLANIDSNTFDGYSVSIKYNYSDDLRNIEINDDGYVGIDASSLTIPNKINRVTLGSDIANENALNGIVKSLTILETPDDEVGSTQVPYIYNESLTNVGISDLTPPDALSVDGAIALKSQSSEPEATQDYGKIYVNADGYLIFKNEFNEIPFIANRNGVFVQGRPVIQGSPPGGESDPSQFVATFANQGRAPGDYNVLKLSLGEDSTDASDSFLSCYNDEAGTGNGTVMYRITGAGTTVSLTAQHWVVYQTEDGYALEDEISPGMILESTGELGIDGGIEEAIPVVKLCSTANSKKVFGVLSSDYNTGNDMYIWRSFTKPFNNASRRSQLFRTDGTYRIENDISTYSSDSRYFKARANSGGEGKIWVSNLDGYVENGDYIVSSEIPGYGAKQSDDIVYNYTVAKCTQDVDWDSITDTITFNDQDYKIALVSCTYHCG